MGMVGVTKQVGDGTLAMFDSAYAAVQADLAARRRTSALSYVFVIHSPGARTSVLYNITRQPTEGAFEATNHPS